MEQLFTDAAPVLAELLADRFQGDLADDMRSEVKADIIDALTRDEITPLVYEKLLKKVRGLPCTPQTLGQLTMSITSFRTLACATVVSHEKIVSVAEAITGPFVSNEVAEVQKDMERFRDRARLEGNPHELAIIVFGAVSVKSIAGRAALSD